MPSDDPPHVVPPTTSTQPLSYATGATSGDRHAYAKMTWRNDGRMGCLAMLGICVILPSLYCAAGRYMPHVPAAFAGGAIAVAGVGLYCGLKDGVWGFLAGAGVAVGIIAAIFLLLYSVLGIWFR